MPKAEIPKRNFSLTSNPLVLFRRIFKGYIAFDLQKDNKTDHLKEKKLLTSNKQKHILKPSSKCPGAFLQIIPCCYQILQDTQSSNLDQT